MDLKADLRRDFGAVLVVDLVQVADKAFLNFGSALGQRARDVVNQVGTVGLGEDLTEQITGLLVVAVWVCVRIAAGRAVDRFSVPGMLLVLDGSGNTSRFIVLGFATTAVDGHWTIADLVGAHASSVGTVDGNLVVVSANAMTVRIWVIQESSLKHLIVRWLNSWDHVGWCKGTLLGFGVEVFGVAIQDYLTNRDQRIVAMRPDFGNIVDIISVGLSVREGHDLDEPVPGCSATVQQCLVQVSGCEVRVFHAFLGRFFSREILDSLGSLEVILNQESFALGIDPLESVRAIAIHVAISVGCTAVREQNHDLMLSLGSVAPEVERSIWVCVACLRASLLGVDEIRELDGVSDEENWRVVSDHVVVSFLGVELDGESSGVSVTVVGTTLAGNCRKPQEDGRLLANLVQEGGPREAVFLRD